MVGTPGPLDDYCGSGSNLTESKAPLTDPVSRQPTGTVLPFAPYYFPHVVRNADGSLTGYFDYRPKDADEAIVAATSTNGGTSWSYDSEALEQNPEYCPTADTNDDGEGHPNVVSVGGSSYLYTLERGAGDNVGVGLLVHQLTPTASNPLGGAPATEMTGIDPDDFASGAVPITASATSIGLTNPLPTSGPEQLVPGPFVDLTQTPTPTASDIISCTGVTVGSPSSLTGCTTSLAGGISVASGDLIEQVIATISSNLKGKSPASGCKTGSSVPGTTSSFTGSLPCTVPVGPNTTTGDGGLEGFGLSVTNANNLTMGIFNLNAPNRAYIDGIATYCNQSNALPTNKIENCSTGPGGSSTLTVNVGDPVTSDPIIPSTAQQTTGLVAPDGIVGVVPSYPGAPIGSTVMLYTEKILNYYTWGYYNGSATTFTNGMNLTMSPFPNSASSLPTATTTSPVVVDIGDGTTNSIVTETCSGGFNATTDTLESCSGATSGDTLPSTAWIAAANGCAAPQSTLGALGEGSTKSSAAEKLWANNEDLTVLRAAYTTDGVDFSSTGLANGGIISGASNGATNYEDITNPTLTSSPSNLNVYSAAGTPDATEMRFVGSGGSIITNLDGSYGLFLSGFWCGDGDSDAFNQIFYASSTDGENWTIPSSVISTDYTFSASAAQEAHPTSTLGVSAYYSGRAYGPSVVQNPDGSLTMVFAGYRLPKPISPAGTAVGTNSSAPYTIGATDPALYRNILTVTLSVSPAAATPESPLSVGLPLLAVLLLGGSLFVFRRRRAVRVEIAGRSRDPLRGRGREPGNSERRTWHLRGPRERRAIER